MDIAIFRPKIEAILRASDLETVSAKRVRKQLTEAVGLDLAPYKSELNALIKSCFDAVLEPPPPPSTQVVKSEPLEQPPDVREAPPRPKKQKIEAEVKRESLVSAVEDADERYARELQAQFTQPRASRSSGVNSTPKRKRTTTTATKRRRKRTETMVNSDGETVEVEVKRRAPVNNGFNKLLTLSDELAALLGTPYLSRPQVSKQIWAYIKAPGRNLQDPNDKRYINCDETLTALLGTPRVHMFSMTKILQRHMRDDGTAPIGFGAGEDVKSGHADLVDSEEEEAKVGVKKQEESSSEDVD